jgi:hypothetical protein
VASATLSGTVVNADDAGWFARTNATRPAENIESEEAGYKWGGIILVF